MSHVVNPILFRLKYSNFWNSACVSYKKSLFFLNSKNVFVISYLKKIMNRFKFGVNKFIIFYFKIAFYMKSINIFFMFRNRRSLATKKNSAYFLNLKLKLRFYRLFYIYAKGSNYHNPRFSVSRLNIKYYNAFMFFKKENLYYIRKYFNKIKAVKNISKIMKSSMNLLGKPFLGFFVSEKQFRKNSVDWFNERKCILLLKIYAGMFYKKFKYALDDNTNKMFNFIFKKLSYSLFTFMNNGESIFEKVRKFKNRSKLERKRNKSFFLYNKINPIKLVKIGRNSFFGRLKKLKLPKKGIFGNWIFPETYKYRKRRQFVLRATDNLGFELNRWRRFVHKTTLYENLKKNGFLFDKLNLKVKETSLWGDKKQNKKHLNILYSKNAEYKPYKIWKLSKNYLKDIDSMYKASADLNYKNFIDKRLFIANKLKFMGWKSRKYYYREQMYYEYSEKYYSKIRTYPISGRRVYGYRIWRTFARVKGYFKFRRRRKRIKKKKLKIYKKEKFLKLNFDKLKNKEFFKDRTLSRWKKWMKTLNGHSWSSMYKVFLKKRNYWEKNIVASYKFFNTYKFKLIHHYLTFLFYKCFGIEWFSLFSKFLYERQRRLFMPNNWKEILNPASRRVILWYRWEHTISKYKTLGVRVKKHLFSINYKGYFKSKLRRKRYWKRRLSKIRYAYPKRRKRRFFFSRRRFAFRRRIKFKKTNKFKNFLASFRSIYFVLYQSFYALFFKKKIALDLGLMFSFKSNFNVYFFINNKRKLILNSKILFYYIKKRIFRGVGFVRLLRYVMRKLKKLYRAFKIDGFAIVLNGRFSKKDRATQHWFKHGKFTKSTRISRLDHYRGEMFLKYSLCSLKINIMRNNYRHRLKKKKEKLKKIKNINKLNAILL